MARLEKKQPTNFLNSNVGILGFSRHLNIFYFGLGYIFGVKLRELQNANPIKFFTFKEIINKYLKADL